MKNEKNENTKITLSQYTEYLIKNLKSIRKKPLIDEFSKIEVSQTVSFFAIAYEKIRNAIQYRENHLLRRAAIERIVKRRLLINPTGEREGENIIRELLWAGYFKNGTLSIYDAQRVQKIINNYVVIRQNIIVGRSEKEKRQLSQFLFDILTCEIEETLSQEQAQKKSIWSFFMFNVLRKKIKIEGIDEELKDVYFYSSIEKTYIKNDRAYLRYHLFLLMNKPLIQYSVENIDYVISEISENFKKIDSIINNQFKEKLNKFVKKQSPPFLILQTIIEKEFNHVRDILTSKKKLWQQVDITCRSKYQQTKQRLMSTAIKSLIYIFLTKMIFAIILEYPLSLYFYNEVNYQSIAINTIFPAALMLIIVTFVKIPGQKNTKKIFERIINILDADQQFETTVALIQKKSRRRRPVLVFGFTLFYALTFIVTLWAINYILNLIQFNLISKLIFIFFVSVVTFFAYRVRQISKEYKLEEKESFFSPFIDFFFMPILSIGKFFSSEISKINVLIFFFDFILEAPFKLIFEIFEEWISFVKHKKEEIV